MVVISRIESTLLYFTKSYYRQSFKAMSNFAGVYSLIHVTIPSSCVASISRALIEEKLAGSVNIVKNVKAVYEWKNTIVDDVEDLLIIRTRTDTVDALTKYIKEHHPYTVCEVISVPIHNGNEEFFKSIDEVVPSINERDK